MSNTPQNGDTGPQYDPRAFLRQAAATPRHTDIRSAVHEAEVGHARNNAHASQIHVQFLRDAKHGPEFDDRHNQLLVTRRLVEALLSGNPESIAGVRQEIEGRGGFLMHYNGEGEHRFANVYDPGAPRAGGWLMAQTTGKMNGAPVQVLGADGQFYVAPDDERPFDTSMPIPEYPSDRPVEGDAVLAEISNDPRIAMLVADIAAVREYQALGLAAATEDAAFARVAQEINYTRTHKIRYALAAIASIKGLQNASGKDLAPPMDPGMRNLRSILLHTVRRKSSPGMILAQLRGRTTDVELPCGDAGKLIVDWYVTAQPIENAVTPKHVTVSDEIPGDGMGGA